MDPVPRYRIYRQGCRSGSYRYFGNIKLNQQGKNILKIEVLHIFRWIFPFFQIKIIMIQISEEICLMWKKFRCLNWFLVTASRIRDPDSVFKILIFWIRIRPKMDRIRNPASNNSWCSLVVSRYLTGRVGRYIPWAWRVGTPGPGWPRGRGWGRVGWGGAGPPAAGWTPSAPAPEATRQSREEDVT